MATPVSDLMGKIGLFTETGHYDVSRYPWAYQAWKKQQQVHWLGEEVPLTADVSDWKRLSEQERNLLMQIFRFFTQSDVEVGDNYLKRYIPIFKPLELQMMMAAFTSMETVHIDAYALLLTTLGIPSSEFQAFHQYSEMQAKADYMSTFGVNTDGDVARTLAMFGAFTEGMALFASFGMLMNFPRFGKMKGMGQIVAWSVRDETLHANSIIRLFHELNSETGCVTKAVKDDIVDVAKTMVSMEEAFIDLAFKMGDIQGLTAEDMKRYVRYICDYRLKQLQLPTVFDTKEHPLPWLHAMLNGVEHANFFETRPTEYSKSASTGTWEGIWGLFDERNSRLLQGDGAALSH